MFERNFIIRVKTYKYHVKHYLFTMTEDEILEDDVFLRVAKRWRDIIPELLD